MSVFIELHALRSFPPSNLNRDDLGTPKTALFGASRRLRISSQSLKRTWRVSEQFKGAFADGQLGVRTERLPDEVLKSLGASFDDVAKAGLLSLLTSLGKKDKSKAESSAEAGEAESDAGESDGDADASSKNRTSHLLFVSRQEIEAVTEFAQQNADALRAIFEKKKPNAEKVKKLREKLRAHLEEKTKRNAVDIGLFGRFVTSDEFDTIDAALQVAHGLGTQKVEVEYDYFTAVDDLSNETGAGHLGETEFASSVLYLYACCDLAQLEKNLGKRTKEGREADAEASVLARRSLPALVKAMALATPAGKKTGTAPHTPAEYVEVVVRKGSPLNFANAFLKSVDGHEGGGDVMKGSISRLAAHRDTLETAYGRDRDVVVRLVLSLREVADVAKAESQVKNLDDFTQKLAAALEKIPPEAKK